MQQYARRLMMFVLMLFLFLGENQVVFAQEKVSVQADGRLVFAVDSGDVYAEGNVRLVYEDIELRADRARYDSEEKKAYLTGAVEMNQNGQVVQAQSVVYDFTTQSSQLDQADLQVTGKGMHGFAFVSGGKITSTAQVMHIEDGTVTTCDLEQPHYHLRSKSIDIYPDEKIVVRNVVYYEGKIPLFYWPYLVIPIAKTGDGAGGVNTFEFPRVGHNDSDGWYVKTAYNYYRSRESYGKVRLDWMQKKGWGKGVEHTYQDDENGYGELSLYHLGRSDWGQSVSTDWIQQLEWGQGWKLDSDLSYVNWDLLSGKASDLFAEVDLSQQTRVSGLTAQLDANSSTYADGTLDQDILGRVGYTRSWDQRWKVRLGADLRRLADSYADAEVVQYHGYVGEVVLTERGYQAGVTLEREINPDLLTSTVSSVDWTTASDTPRLFWRSRNWRWFDGWLPMLFTAAYSNHSEEYPNGSSRSGDVYTVSGGVNNKVWNLTPKTRLSYTGTVRQDWYNGLSERPGGEGLLAEELSPQSRLALLSRVSLRYQPYRPVTVTLGYNDNWLQGESPFLRDEIEVQEKVTGRIDYRRQSVSASLFTGYDFHSQEYDDLIGRVGYHPSEDLNFDLQADYDLQEQALDSVYVLASAKPLTGWELQVGTSYNAQLEQWDRFDARTTAKLPWGLSVQHLISYNGATDSLLYNDIAVTKDLHCREVTLRYDTVDEEIWLEFGLKAFPRTKLLAGTDDDELLFDAQGIQELVNIVNE